MKKLSVPLKRTKRRRRRIPKSNTTLTHPSFLVPAGPTGEELLQMAKKLELEELARIRFTPACVTYLDGLLFYGCFRQCPEPIDYHNRRDLVHIFNAIAKEVYGDSDSCPVVEGYGSFVMDMFNQKSDLDLSINFNNSSEIPREKKIDILKRFHKKLRSLERTGYVTGVQLIKTARVPIVKVTDNGTGIDCDLSVENRDGIAKSNIIHAISAIDERFRALCFLMKSWAQAHNINSSKDRTLNSLSIVSFVAFHLQTCDPPILPPFSALLKEGADLASVTKVVRTYLNYGNKNRESLAKLFITLFVKLASVEKFWEKGFCVSLYEGSWILKSWGHRTYSISIEDFTDPSQNVARAVGPEELRTIYRCIHHSLYYLLVFLNGQMQEIQLMEFLFGKHTVSTQGVEVIRNIIEHTHNLSTLQNPHPPKKMRIVEGIVNNQVQQPIERKYFVQGLQGTESQVVGRMQQVEGIVNKQVQQPIERNYFVQGLQGTESQGVGRMQQALGETRLNAHATFTPPVSYQPPRPIPSTDIKVHRGYGAEAVPSSFASNPVAFDGFYNPSIPSRPVPSRSSFSFAGTSHQQAVAPNTFGESIQSHLPHVSHHPYRGDYLTQS